MKQNVEYKGGIWGSQAASPHFSYRCFSEESCVSIPEVEGYVVVLQPDAPQILLGGTAHFARPAVDFEGTEGVALFPDLQITCSISHQVEAKKDESWQGTGKGDPGERLRPEKGYPCRTRVRERNLGLPVSEQLHPAFACLGGGPWVYRNWWGMAFLTMMLTALRECP